MESYESDSGTRRPASDGIRFTSHKREGGASSRLGTSRPDIWSANSDGSCDTLHNLIDIASHFHHLQGKILGGMLLLGRREGAKNPAETAYWDHVAAVWIWDSPRTAEVIRSTEWPSGGREGEAADGEGKGRNTRPARRLGRGWRRRRITTWRPTLGGRRDCGPTAPQTTHCPIVSRRGPAAI